jgi:hypothetical protein
MPAFTTQSGRYLPFGTIITGLSKADEVLQTPFLAYQHALHTALSRAGSLVVAGYGLSDPHVNAAIAQFFTRRRDTRLYIVDFDPAESASDYLLRLRRVCDLWASIASGESGSLCFEEISGFTGWHRMRCVSGSGAHGLRVAVWLRGFRAFCESVVDPGLPPLV